jgi:hypothetical protein
VSDERLSVEAEEFVARAIESIEQVEVLLLLRGGSERWWTADQIARELGMTTTAADIDASALQAKGLLATQGTSPRTYRYEPRNLLLLAGAESVAAAYKDQPVILAKAIASRSEQVLRTFSDAFLFRRRR